MDDDRSVGIDAVAALAEPTRRRLYEHVVRQAAPVGRDDVARDLALPRATVAFHLDRLVSEGLLDVHFERRSGRSGPGAGRPAKLYRRSQCSVTVSLPERRYDLAGDLLAAALVEAELSGERPAAVLDRRAYARGRELAEAAGDGGGREAILRVLEEYGFEPRTEGAGVALGNCPFHTLAQQHTELVCGMNLRFLDGLLDGSRGRAAGAPFAARLSPEPGRCCVRLEPPASA